MSGEGTGRVGWEPNYGAAERIAAQVRDPSMKLIMYGAALDRQENERIRELEAELARFAESEARLKEGLRLIEVEARNAIRCGFLHQHEWVKVLNLAEQRGSWLDTVQRTEEGT